jgi:L-gulonate 3-dehydrogenase
VAHPINPPYLIPAVEIIPAPWTTGDAIERTSELMRSAGHAPIVMKKEIDGFLVNRLQGALLEEAFRLVADGYATVEDVDVALRDGLALRWSFIGPFETIDLNAPGGVRDYAERYEKIYARIFPSTQRRIDWSGPTMDGVEADRRKLLPADKLAERQAWRDRRLMALAAHKKRASEELGD